MSIKSLIRSAVNVLPTGPAESIANLYRRVRYPVLRRRMRHSSQVLRAYGRPHEVLQGPFRGMAYIARAHYSQLVPKILGTYELELWPAIEQIIAANPGAIVDIGAAEGYYAVGLARRLPSTRIVTFEMQPEARSLMRELAARNGLNGRFDMRETANPAAVRKVLSELPASSRPALICDVEGYEDVLMDPAAVPELRSATMLIEVHELDEPGLSGRLRERFAASHNLQVIPTRPRTPADLPPGGSAPPEAAADAMWERDIAMEWFFFVPK